VRRLSRGCAEPRALGSKRLDEIRPREIEAFKSRKLKEGLSPKTVNNFLTILRKLLATAVEWNLLLRELLARPQREIAQGTGGAPNRLAPPSRSHYLAGPR
jgi:hypothetical protein